MHFFGFQGLPGDRCSAMLSDAQRCSAMLSDAQRCSGMQLRFIKLALRSGADVVPVYMFGPLCSSRTIQNIHIT